MLESAIQFQATVVQVYWALRTSKNWVCPGNSTMLMVSDSLCEARYGFNHEANSVSVPDLRHPTSRGNFEQQSYSDPLFLAFYLFASRDRISSQLEAIGWTPNACCFRTRSCSNERTWCAYSREGCSVVMLIARGRVVAAVRDREKCVLADVSVDERGSPVYKLPPPRSLLPLLLDWAQDSLAIRLSDLDGWIAFAAFRVGVIHPVVKGSTQWIPEFRWITWCSATWNRSRSFMPSLRSRWSLWAFLPRSSLVQLGAWPSCCSFICSVHGRTFLNVWSLPSRVIQGSAAVSIMAFWDPEGALAPRRNKIQPRT